MQLIKFRVCRRLLPLNELESAWIMGRDTLLLNIETTTSTFHSFADTSVFFEHVRGCCIALDLFHIKGLGAKPRWSLVLWMYAVKWCLTRRNLPCTTEKASDWIGKPNHHWAQRRAAPHPTSASPTKPGQNYTFEPLKWAQLDASALLDSCSLFSRWKLFFFSFSFFFLKWN